MDGAVGLIVAGGDSPLELLAGAADAALTPFAGMYRFVDLALATLENSGVRRVYVAGAGASHALAAHVARLGRGRPEGRRPALVILPPTPAHHQGRAGRLLHALTGCRDAIESEHAEAVVVLLADHILHLDLRPLRRAHLDQRADLTLAALPVPLAEAQGCTILDVSSDARVGNVQRRPARPVAAPGSSAFALSWAGDLLLEGRALPAALASARGAEPDDDAAILRALARALHVASFDVLEGMPAGRTPHPPPYWLEPATVEAYYEAQMNLCSARPALDLHDPGWPLVPAASGLGPAKVVADATGRAGQALNTLVSDGTIIRGGVVLNAVVGHGVTVESGAEVEDSVLLDGCRVGRGARVRRALLGSGAVIADGEEIGYGGAPTPPARVLRSGLTLVPPAPPPVLAAVSGR